MTAIEERIKQQEEKLKQLKALKQKQEAALRTAQVKKTRADETRRKILLGALVMEWTTDDEEFNVTVMQRLNQFLTRKVDRVLFDLSVDAEPVIQPEQQAA